MRIAHCHRDRGVPEDPLQAEDVPTTHHVVAGEGVSEDMGHLPWCMEATALVSTTERSPAGHKQPTIPRQRMERREFFTGQLEEVKAMHTKNGKRKEGDALTLRVLEGVETSVNPAVIQIILGELPSFDPQRHTASN
ncbi:hypothetical protein D3C84_970080 [compost metagenome]